MDSITNTESIDNTTKIVTNALASNLPWTTPGVQVLNISASPKTQEPKNKRRTKNSKNLQLVQQPAAVINYNTFPRILSRIFFKSDTELAVLNLTGKDQSYLGLFGFRNQVTRTQTFHMFCTNTDELPYRFNRANQLYANNKDLQFLDRTFIHTICARSLYRRAQIHFQEFKWSKQGNVFEVPTSVETAWMVFDKFRDLNKLEMKRIFNFLKFLHYSKS